MKKQKKYKIQKNGTLHFREELRCSFALNYIQYILSV